MKRTLFERWDLGDVHATLETISLAFYSKHGFGPYRQQLEQRRDDLHELCVSFEQSGDAEEFDDLYFAMFDALSYLTSALRGRAINANYLAMCRDALEKAQREVAHT